MVWAIGYVESLFLGKGVCEIKKNVYVTVQILFLAQLISKITFRQKNENCPQNNCTETVVILHFAAELL